MSNKKQIYKNGQVGNVMDKHNELENVTEAMKQAKERRMYERYQAIYLHLKGTSTIAIAGILNRNRMTVSSYIHMYENGGLAALQLKYSSGAPTRLTKEQQDQLKQTIAYSVRMRSALRLNTTGRLNSLPPMWSENGVTAIRS